MAERRVELRYPNFRAGTKLLTKALLNHWPASSVLSGFITTFSQCETTSDNIHNPVFFLLFLSKFKPSSSLCFWSHHSKSRKLSEPGAVKSNRWWLDDTQVTGLEVSVPLSVQRGCVPPWLHSPLSLACSFYGAVSAQLAYSGQSSPI